MDRSALPLTFRCTESWEAMPGDDRTRHCAKCDRDVIDLSAGTELAARLRLATARRAPCVRYASRADGTVVFRPGRVARLAAAVLALLAPRAEAGDADSVHVCSATVRSGPSPRVGPHLSEQTVDFGVGPSGVAFVLPRDLARPRGDAVVHVRAAPGRWDRVRLRCEGFARALRAPLVKGEARFEDLPGDATCRLRLAGEDRTLRVELTAGHASAELPVRRR